MNERIVPLDADIHHTVQTLLPWYVNDSLGAEEHARVQAHLAHCPRCQSEAAWERNIQAAHAALPLGGDVEAGLARLHRQLPPASRRPAGGWLQRAWAQWGASPLWMRGALAAQCAALLLALTLPALRPAAEGRYRALGAPDNPRVGNVVVMFTAEAREQDIRRALRAANARLVDGPTASDAYLLSVSPAQATQTIAALKRAPGVMLAEPLGQAAP